MKRSRLFLTTQPELWAFERNDETCCPERLSENLRHIDIRSWGRCAAKIADLARYLPAGIRGGGVFVSGKFLPARPRGGKRNWRHCALVGRRGCLGVCFRL